LELELDRLIFILIITKNVDARYFLTL